MSHRYVYARLSGGRLGFIVLAQPAAPVQPRQGSLRHPPAGQHLKDGRSPGAAHCLLGPGHKRLRPSNQSASIAAVRLVLSQTEVSGYNRRSLDLASLAVKPQLMVAPMAFRSASEALISLFGASSSGLRPLRQARARTLNSISAIPSASSG